MAPIDETCGPGPLRRWWLAYLGPATDVAAAALLALGAGLATGSVVVAIAVAVVGFLVWTRVFSGPLRYWTGAAVRSVDGTVLGLRDGFGRHRTIDLRAVRAVAVAGAPTGRASLVQVAKGWTVLFVQPDVGPTADPSWIGAFRLIGAGDAADLAGRSTHAQVVWVAPRRMYALLRAIDPVLVASGASMNGAALDHLERARAGLAHEESDRLRLRDVITRQGRRRA